MCGSRGVPHPEVLSPASGWEQRISRMFVASERGISSGDTGLRGSSVERRSFRSLLERFGRGGKGAWGEYRVGLIMGS